MSAIERLLVPGSTELPACHCGDEMRIASLDPAPQSSDAHIRIYKCPSCAREMRLTVWSGGLEIVARGVLFTDEAASTVSSKLSVHGRL
jgi:hypothetical protein